jgi:hypothetical protein
MRKNNLFCALQVLYFLASTNDGPPAEIMESPTRLSHQCESDT